MKVSVLSKLFGRVESDDMFLKISLSNTASSFIELVLSEGKVIEVRNLMQVNTERAKELVDRINELLSTETDATKLHKYDHSIAVYLIILAKSNISLFISAIKIIREKNIRNLWWTSVVGNHLLKNSLKTRITAPEEAFHPSATQSKEELKDHVDEEVEPDDNSISSSDSQSEMIFNQEWDNYA